MIHGLFNILKYLCFIHKIGYWNNCIILLFRTSLSHHEICTCTFYNTSQSMLGAFGATVGTVLPATEHIERIFVCSAIYRINRCCIQNWREYSHTNMCSVPICLPPSSGPSSRARHQVDESVVCPLVCWLFVVFNSPSRNAGEFSNADLSVGRPSVCPSVKSRLRGEGLSQKRFSKFSSFWHGASLGRHKRINHISKDKFGHFSRSVRSNLALFALGGHLLQNCSATFSLFWHRASQKGY